MGVRRLGLTRPTAQGTGASMISYSLNREDVVLARVLADVAKGFYVDVGANDPTIHSNTRHFYDAGWSGINIEPGRMFERLAQERPRDRNLNVAASDATGELPFHEFPVGHALSSLHERQPLADSHYLKDVQVRMVPVRTLRDIFCEIDPPTIDFMSVDVESHERQVLLGNDWSTWRPRVVLVEATLEGRHEPGHHLWENILLEAGYLFAYHDGLNRFYLREEDRHRLDRIYPACVFDRFQSYEEAKRTEECNRLNFELATIHRGTGRRTLAIGLAVARTLQRVSRLFRRRAG